MGKKKLPGIDLDWYLISIDKIKKVFLYTVLILAVGGSGYLAFNYFKSPRTKAKASIKRAQDLADQIAQLKNFSELKNEYVDLQKIIQEGNKLFLKGDYPEALKQGSEATSMAIKILDSIQGSTGREADAKIMRLEGKVEIQRRSEGVWDDAKPRDDLFEGDFVKTGKDGACEIMVGNLMIKLGSNTLYEVTEKKRATSPGKSKVRIVTGNLNIFTQSKGVDIETPVFKADINERSAAELKTDSKTKRGDITVHGGTAKVQVGDQEVDVGEMERLEVSGNHIRDKKKILPPPQILAPPENKAFSVIITSSEGVLLDWSAVKGAARYHLQISNTSFFTKLLVDSKRHKTSTTIKVPDLGSYYWRVSAIDSNGEEGAFSPLRKFRIASPKDINQAEPVAPRLTVENHQIIGHSVLIRGTVESGAQVEIEGEKVMINSDGTFNHFITFDEPGMQLVVIKATNTSGGETVKRIQVPIEVE